jgi:hypothetical protein
MKCVGGVLRVGEGGDANKIFVVNLKGRDHMGSHTTHGSITLNLFLEKQDDRF